MRKYIKISEVKGGRCQRKEPYPQTKTVPNMSYSIKELINMHKKGIAPAVLKRALWEMDQLGEELNPLRKPGFDLSDVDKIMKTVKIHQDRIEAENKRKLQQKNEELRRKHIEDYLAERDKNKDGIDDRDEQKKGFDHEKKKSK